MKDKIYQFSVFRFLCPSVRDYLSEMSLRRGIDYVESRGIVYRVFTVKASRSDIESICKSKHLKSVFRETVAPKE